MRLRLLVVAGLVVLLALAALGLALSTARRLRGTVTTDQGAR